LAEQLAEQFPSFQACKQFCVRHYLDGPIIFLRCYSPKYLSDRYLAEHVAEQHVLLNFYISLRHRLKNAGLICALFGAETKQFIIWPEIRMKFDKRIQQVSKKSEMTFLGTEKAVQISKNGNLSDNILNLIILG
jgi:hypothetical protein